MNLSKNLNFPKIRISRQKNNIINVHDWIFNEFLKRDDAIPAVTIVTAACIVNIVAKLNTK
jgi:hypothetical protein